MRKGQRRGQRSLQQAGREADWLAASKRCQSFNRVRIAFYEQNERGGLCIRLGAILLPFFQGSFINEKRPGKNGTRTPERFTYFLDSCSGNLGQGDCFYLVAA